MHSYNDELYHWGIKGRNGACVDIKIKMGL